MPRTRWLALGALTFLAACSGPRLDTRTFALHHISGGTAGDLIKPYVYADRAKAPGEMSFSHDAITVRETPDNLDKIARVLAEFDRTAPFVRLHFQLIQADGPAASDPRIADVVTELRKLFRFGGYRLLAETLMSGSAETNATQNLAGDGQPYELRAHIGDVRAAGDSGTVQVTVRLTSRQGALETSIVANLGQTVVLGNGQFGTGGTTLILTVRPELAK